MVRAHGEARVDRDVYRYWQIRQVAMVCMWRGMVRPVLTAGRVPLALPQQGSALLMPERMSREGQRLGNYRLLRLLGRGGFAEVYLGQHIHLNTYAAIKLLLNAQLSPGEIAKFRREARLVAALRHPHIVSVLDFAAEEGEPPYLVLDYAPNGSLRQRHPSGSIVPPALVLRYLEQVGDALYFAHGRGIIHRDIKPDNMLLSADDDVLLSDFGIATVSASASLEGQTAPQMAGTLPYMAPEQLQGRAGRASDQYALAVVTFEWLCGERPFRGTLPEIIAKHLNASPPSLHALNPAISPALEEVVLTALAKDPRERYPGVADYVAAFRQAFASQARASRSPSARRAPSPPPSRRAANPPTAEPQRSRRAPIDDRDLPPGTILVPPIPSNAALSPEKPKEAQIQAIGRRRTLWLLGGALVAVGGAGIIAWEELPRLLHKGSAIGNNGPAQITGSGKTATGTNIPAGTTFHVYSGHTDIVNAVAWSPDGNYIVSGSRDRTAQLWNAITANPIFTYTQHKDIVTSLAWSPDSKFIASGSFDQTVQVWDAATRTRAAVDQSPNSFISTVAWSSTRNRLAFAGEGGTVQIYEAPGGNSVYSYSAQANYTYSIAWSPDGTLLASGSGGTTEQVLIWDIANGRKFASYTNHKGPVYSVAWSHDGKYLASCGYDATVRIWNVTTGEQAFVYGDHRGPVNTVGWSTDDKLIASGGNDKTVKIWTSNGGITLHTYSDHLDSVKALSWSPNGNRIASASADKTVRIWQAT